MSESSSSSDPFSSKKWAENQAASQGSHDYDCGLAKQFDKAHLDELKRMQRLASALEDEGSAVWAMQRDSLRPPQYDQLISKYHFSNKQEQLQYITKKLRLIEGKPIIQNQGH